MTNNPLYVSFVWHMHQPYYKDPSTDIYRLPWVRLHGTKDYLDMLEILKDFPGIRQNFNLVPSLLEQLNDYTENNAKDSFLEATRKKASDLTPDDKIFILENFFLAHWGNMIKPFPRYYELLVKRGTHFIKGDLVRMIKYFSESDFLDLQVLFNLCWIDPFFRENDPFLKMLVEKGRNYTEDEKSVLIEKQMDNFKKDYSGIQGNGIHRAGRTFTFSLLPPYHPPSLRYGHCACSYAWCKPSQTQIFQARRCAEADRAGNRVFRKSLWLQAGRHVAFRRFCQRAGTQNDVLFRHTMGRNRRRGACAFPEKELKRQFREPD